MRCCLAVVQGVEGHVVQQVVGHEDEVVGVQPRAQRRHQLLVELGEVGLGGRQRRLARRRGRRPRRRAGPGELELEQAQDVLHARHEGDGDDLQAVAGDAGRRAGASRRGSTRRAWRPSGRAAPDLVAGEGSTGASTSIDSLSDGGQLAQDAQQLALAGAHLLCSASSALGRPLFRPPSARPRCGGSTSSAPRAGRSTRRTSSLLPADVGARRAWPRAAAAPAGCATSPARRRRRPPRHRRPRPAALEREVDERLVDLELVLHERDLQLLAAQAAAQRLQEALGAPVGVVGARRARAAACSIWPAHVVELEAEGGQVERGRGPARRRRTAARAASSSPMRRAMRARSSRHRMALLASAGDAEGLQGGLAVAARLEQAARPRKDQRLVEVEQRGPDRVLLGDEQRARLRAQLEGAQDLALLAVGDGEVAEGLGRLVADAAAAGSPAMASSAISAASVAEVQLEVDLGEVEQAQRGEVRVAQRLGRRRASPSAPRWRGRIGRGSSTGRRCCSRPGPTSRGMPVLLAERARPLVRLQGAREVVQADEAHRHVAERDRDALGVAVGQQAARRPARRTAAPPRSGPGGGRCCRR